MRNDLIEVFGIEMAESEVKGCIEWLKMEDAKPFKKILEALTKIAESNSMKDFEEDRNVSLSEKARERYLGERRGLLKISGMADSLRSRL